MNQFQILIHDCLIHTKHVESAAILVAKSGHVSAMFIDAFKYLTIIREQGIFFDEKAFTCVRADRNSIYCKCGDNGLILVKTALFVIVATYNENMYPSVCVEASEKLAEYLREKGK
uniref:Profilin n=1 Tax=Electrophorus electricus TaxID=8005 RepID=A0A4W4E9L0_ELEEL